MKRATPLLVLVLAFSVACTGSTKHKLTVWVDSPLYSAISALDASEFAGYRSGLINEATHRDLNPVILRLAKSGRHVNEIVDALPVGAPAPENLRAVVNEAFGALEDIVRLATPAKADAILAQAERVRQALLALSPIIPALIGGK